MKRCPTCNRTFTDRNLSFCIDDGTPLVPVVAEAGRSPNPNAANWNAPPYQPPGTYVPPGSSAPRRVWPWIVGILAILLLAIVGLGVVAAIYLPRMLEASANKNRSVSVNLSNRNDPNSNLNANSYTNENVNKNSNANVNTNPNANINANTNVNSNIKSNDNDNSNTPDISESPPPTDTARVLTDLTDLEYQWTVANINADTKVLDRILADDYVGITGDGKPQGKRQYLRDIKRDP